MRERGVEIADIAILVVSAEDGVKAQTLEAWKTIDARKLPYVVAINKSISRELTFRRRKILL
jgi:translation initiation factor IF-2